jgi:hypothetical protein
LNHELQQWKVKRLGHCSSYGHWANLSNFYRIDQDCPNLSKSISLRELIPLICLWTRFTFSRGMACFSHEYWHPLSRQNTYVDMPHS